MKRFFLIYYKWTDAGRMGAGYLSLSTTVFFPSKSQIEAEVLKGHPAKDIVITGFNEFKSEKDYNSFVERK